VEGNSAVGRDEEASIAIIRIIHGTFHGLISNLLMIGYVNKKSVFFY
jgi:hypothetical protein